MFEWVKFAGFEDSLIRKSLIKIPIVHWMKLDGRAKIAGAKIAGAKIAGHRWPGTNRAQPGFCRSSNGLDSKIQVTVANVSPDGRDLFGIRLCFQKTV